MIEPNKEVYSVGERVHVNFYLENKNRYPIELDSYVTAGVAHFKPDNAPIFIHAGVFYTPAGRTFVMPPDEKYTIHGEITFRCEENMIGDYMIKLVVGTAGGDVSKVKTIKIVAEG